MDRGVGRACWPHLATMAASVQAFQANVDAASRDYICEPRIGAWFWEGCYGADLEVGRARGARTAAATPASRRVPCKEVGLSQISLCSRTGPAMRASLLP